MDDDAISMQQQNRHFINRINAFYIQCRIGFGKTQRLRLLQCGVVIQFVFAYFGKYKIGGAVYNAANALQQVVVVILFQVADDGDGTANGRFV